MRVILSTIHIKYIKEFVDLNNEYKRTFFIKLFTYYATFYQTFLKSHNSNYFDFFEPNYSI